MKATRNELRMAYLLGKIDGIGEMIFHPHPRKGLPDDEKAVSVRHLLAEIQKLETSADINRNDIIKQVGNA